MPYELSQLDLADVLRLCLVYARADSSRFDRAIVRWQARLCLDARGLDPGDCPDRARRGDGSRGPLPVSVRPPARRNCDDHQLSEVALVLDDPQRPKSAPPPIGVATTGQR